MIHIPCYLCSPEEEIPTEMSDFLKSQGQSSETNSGCSISGCLHVLQLWALIWGSEFHPDHVGCVGEWQGPGAHPHRSHHHHSSGAQPSSVLPGGRPWAGTISIVFAMDFLHNEPQKYM